MTLDELPTGSRLLVRSKTNWRFAAVSRIAEEKIVITVCSPGGHTYRLRRDLDCELRLEGTIPILIHDEPEDWRENFGRYDLRW